MQAIRMEAFGGPEVLRLLEIDRPEPGPGQVLIRVESAAVNFADVMRRRDDLYPFPTELPFIPGSEVAGTVEALGDGVEGPPPGTPVFAVVGGDGSTGYAQFAVADAQQVIPIPPGLSPDEAAGMVIAGTTAMLVLSDVAKLQPGESVLVGGAGGGVGILAVQIARSLGAGTVIGLASSGDRRSAALEAGADHVVDPGDAGWSDEVRDLTGGAGVGVVLEMSGGQVFADGLTTLAPFGRFVVYGMASGLPGVFDEAGQQAFFYRPSLGQSLHVFNLGLYFGLRPGAAIEAMTALIGLVASGQVKVPVGTTLPLEEAAEAHRLIESRQSTGKVILRPWAGSPA
ncbi:MAG: zinc-binding alcohol dehydrogenase family protein [Acidimicrobiales bacterium]